MKEYFEEKYKILKVYIKNNKNKRYDKKIKEEKISLYLYILAYYSAKLDLNIGTERLKDKIMLQKYDKLLLKELGLTEIIDCFIYIQSESKRGNFYDTLDFLKLKMYMDNDSVTNMRNEYDEAYLKTVLEKNQKKLSKKSDEKIHRQYEKIEKILKKTY